MTSCKTHCVFLSLLMFLFALCYQKIFVLSLCCCIVLWILRTKDHSFLFVCIILAIFSIPRGYTRYPDMKEAKAIQVSSSYAVLKSGNQKVIVYTKEPLFFDQTFGLLVTSVVSKPNNIVSVQRNLYVVVYYNTQQRD